MRRNTSSRVASSTIYLWAIAVPGYASCLVSTWLGGILGGAIASLVVAVLVLGVIIGHWLCSREG